MASIFEIVEGFAAGPIDEKTLLKFDEACQSVLPPRAAPN